ncbi:MAG TPA: lipid II flippase MurJ [Actinomycetota bacterium]|nr:lipid II flippase MurJ [Actinomycetota bacterium]
MGPGLPGQPVAAEESEAGLLRSSASISLITAAARVAGFARWIVLGATVGATYLGNTYQTANWVPNILFELAAGGVLTAVFVPTFVAELEHGRERGTEVAASIANGLLLLSLPLVAGAIIFGRPIMRGLTVGVADPAVRAAEIELGAWFLRFFAPQIPLYLLGMVMTGILHAHRKFVAPAAAPLFSSLVVIATYLVFHSMGPRADIGTATREQLYVLAGGTTAGVVALTFSQLPSVLRLGIRWRPVLRLRDPSVRRAMRAGGWGMAFFAVTQAGLLVTLILANRVRGGVVAYQVGYALFMLPVALIGLPVAISLYPSMSRSIVRRDEQGYARVLSLGWRTTALLAAPAAAGLAVLARPLAQALETAGAARTGSALVAAASGALALGLPAYALNEILARAFYARRQTAPPVAVNAVAIGLYAFAACTITAVARPRGADAVAVMGWAHSAGQWAGVAVGVLLLARSARVWRPAGDLVSTAASAARAAVMAACVWLVVHALRAVPPAPRVAAGVLAGAAVFGVACLFSRDARLAMSGIRNRR